MDDTERRAILAEIIALTEPTTLIQPWQFTTADFMREAGLLRHANASIKLKQLVEAGVLKCDRNGYNPTTGRKVTLFWRPEDER
jgi:hypothetical protein